LPLGNIVEGTIYKRGIAWLVGCVLVIVGNLSTVLVLGTKQKKVSDKRDTLPLL
jgi:hypothetical protein